MLKRVKMKPSWPKGYDQFDIFHYTKRIGTLWLISIAVAYLPIALFGQPDVSY